MNVESGSAEFLVASPAPALLIHTHRRKGWWPPCHWQLRLCGTALCAFSKQGDCPLGISKEMTAGAERVMFSDLRSLQLKKTMEIKVFCVFCFVYMERDLKDWVSFLVCG